MADTIIFWPYEDMIKEAGYAKGQRDPRGREQRGYLMAAEELDQMST
jgi:hypothetical protein